MKEILLLIILTGVSFIVFLITLIIGIVKGNNKAFIICGISFIAMIVAAVFAITTTVSKSIHKIKEVTEPRTGMEIYTALFDKPKDSCVEIIDYQDQVVPRIDYAITLHFYTCTNEIKRITSLKNYTVTRAATDEFVLDTTTANNTWFKPNLLGDSLIVYKHHVDGSVNSQTIYTNTKQTEAYAIDIAD